MVGRRGLHKLAVDLARQFEVRTLGRGGVRYEPGTNRRGALERLALEPLGRAALPVPARDVVHDCVPGDGRPAVARSAFRTVAPITRANSASQSGRIGWQVATHLENVRSVVQPDADDLLGSDDQRRAVELVNRKEFTSRRRRIALPARPTQDRDEVARSEIDSPILVQSDRPGAFSYADRCQSHADVPSTSISVRARLSAS